MQRQTNNGNRVPGAGVRRDRAALAPSSRHPSQRVRRALLASVLLMAAFGGPAHAHEMSAMDAISPTAEAAGHAGNPLADKVRFANNRFSDAAEATREGYAPIPCVSGIDGGAMGIHYVNTALIDDKVELEHPEAVLYEPGRGGALELVAVEYIATKGPADLDGHLFSFTDAPNRYGLPAFYELHVWAWRANPTGTFADMNPDVSCDAAEAPGH